MKKLDGREDQNPWSKWFWADYEADTGLRASSLCAQGLWMRMLGIMARSKKRGFLLDGEKQMKSKTLAKLVGEDEAVVDGLIAELEDHDVPSRTEDGTLYSRRMVREARLSEIRSRAGQQGGRPKSKTKANGKANPKQCVKAPSASAYAYASSFLKGQRKKGRSKRGGGSAARPTARTKRADLVRLWNEFAGRRRPGLQQVKPVVAIVEGSERERLLQARLKEPAFDFEKVLAAAEGQPFLFGENERGWTISFDWLLSSSNYVKVLELRYEDRTKGESEIDAWVKKNRGKK